MAGKTRRTSERSTPARKRWKRRLKLALLSGFILVSIVGVAGFWFFQGYLEDARKLVPSLEDKIDELNRKPTIFVSSDGVELFRRTPENRVLVKLDELKPLVWHAMLAAEDKRFMEHGGYDLMGLGRAVVNAATHRKGGGSTITMQLAKQLYNGNDQSVQRKLKDIALARAIEERKSKEQILELYLNYVYFGEGAWGVYVAAKTYFNKTPNDLTPREAAMIARCVRLPGRRNPVEDYDQSIQESDAVLKTMLEEGWITQAEFDKASTERPEVADGGSNGGVNLMRGAPYAVDHAKAELKALCPNVKWAAGGYRVEMTIDTKLQAKAEQEVRQTIEEYRWAHINSGAFVAADRAGRILAEVGGMDYNRSQVNLVTQGRFQPGSSFKAIVYSTGLREGIVHPGDSLPNSQLAIYDPSAEGGLWRPQNSSKRESAGSVSIETAFAQSWNRPAIWTTLAIGAGSFDSARTALATRATQKEIIRQGVAKVVQVAKESFGIDVSDRYRTASIALGTFPVTPLQMLSAYSTFMLKGDRIEGRVVSKVIGPDGEVVYQLSESDNLHRGALDPTIVSQMDALMEGVVERGTGTAAAVTPNARGKTGTTSKNKDAWFCGYTDGLVGVGWVGNLALGPKPGQSKMASSIYGGTVPAKFWGKIMSYAHERFATVISEPEPDSKPERPKDEKKPDETPPLDENGNPIPPGTVKVGPPDTTTPPVGDGDAPPPPTKGPGDEDPRTPAKTPPTRDPDPPSKVGNESEDVEVEICADTGLVANRYCPETVTRHFRRGKEPHKVCSVHHAN